MNLIHDDDGDRTSDIVLLLLLLLMIMVMMMMMITIVIMMKINDEVYIKFTSRHSRTRCPDSMSLVASKVSWVSDVGGTAEESLTVVGERERTTRHYFTIAIISTQLQNENADVKMLLCVLHMFNLFVYVFYCDMFLLLKHLHTKYTAFLVGKLC